VNHCTATLFLLAAAYSASFGAISIVAVAVAVQCRGGGKHRCSAEQGFAVAKKFQRERETMLLSHHHI